MYPPPAEDTIALLVSSVVDLISFGRYVMHISFENGDRLSVACPFRFDTAEAVAQSEICDFPLTASRILRIIGSSVARAECESDGTLHLRFGGGDILIAYANDPQYEAYTLVLGGQEYVV
jgi:hypothetical protein